MFTIDNDLLPMLCMGQKTVKNMLKEAYDYPSFCEDTENYARILSKNTELKRFKKLSENICCHGFCFYYEIITRKLKIAGMYTCRQKNGSLKKFFVVFHSYRKELVRYEKTANVHRKARNKYLFDSFDELTSNDEYFNNIDKKNHKVRVELCTCTN